MHEIQELVRRELTHAMVAAAYAEKMSLQSEGVAFALSPQLSVVNLPVAGIDQIDFKAMLEGYPVLESRPIMYWHLSGPVLREGAVPFGEGFYTVVAQQQRGLVELRDAKGQTVAHGNLRVCIEPGSLPPGVIAKVGVSGGIDKFDVNLKKHHIEVCGHASVSVGGAEVTVEGCVSVDW